MATVLNGIETKFNRVSRVHERYRRQTDDRRQTDGRRTRRTRRTRVHIRKEESCTCLHAAIFYPYARVRWTVHCVPRT